MIYFVSNQTVLFQSFERITPEESIDIMQKWRRIQFDSETNGRDSHINDLLCVQFGNKKEDIQIVVDTGTVDVRLYKEVLESKLLIGQNLKFDLQFLYNYNIHPLKVYDTMIVEQLLHLSYPSGVIPYSLKGIAERRLGIDIDKTVRGEIIWRGLDEEVIKYAAGDVLYLEDILESQVVDLNKQGMINAAILENDVVPAMAYLEWCGIKLDEDKWKAKMKKDLENLQLSIDALNEFVINTPSLKKFIYVDTQGDLFNGFDLSPKVTINWASSKQVIEVAKILGFNVSVQDKKTKEEKESVMEKHLKSQKGINDTFLKLYFGKGEPEDEDYFPGYSGSFKVVTSFGQGHLDAINPNTGRIHTVYRQIGTISSRMSCGSKEKNTELAKLKKLPPSRVGFPNMQQLPHDASTRSCFVSEKGNLFCSCDYSAAEARIGADVYNEKYLLDEFLYRSGDTHAAYAKAVFAEELKDVAVEDIKKKRPDLRSKVKSVEFAVQFGSDGTAIAPQLGISVEEARKLVNNLLSNMSGLKKFKEEGAKFVSKYGYVLIHPKTGHKGYWWDHDKWLKTQESFTPEFWEDYKKNHKGTGDYVAEMVRTHFQAASKWKDRMSLNLPTQGGCAIIIKDAMTQLFKWIIENGYFGKILIVNVSHDELNSEFPENLKDSYPLLVQEIMKDSAAKYYHKLVIPAEASVGDHWIH